MVLTLFFMSFYLIAIYYSFKAYREFKGTAEDILGGPEAIRKHNEQINVIAYGTIAKQDDDIERRNFRRR